MIRILIADDHPIVRSGLRLIVSEHDDIAVVQEAATAGEVIPAIRGTHIDVVVLDLEFPDASGLDVLRDLRQEFPRLPVMVLSIHPEEEHGVPAMSAGATGYLQKGAAPEQLVQAIRAVYSGRRFITPRLADALAVSVSRRREDSLDILSGREALILRRLASGRTITEIAIELSISVKTVSTYRSRLLVKLGGRTTADLIRYAIMNKVTL